MSKNNVPKKSNRPIKPNKSNGQSKQNSFVNTKMIREKPQSENITKR